MTRARPLTAAALHEMCPHADQHKAIDAQTQAEPWRWPYTSNIEQKPIRQADRPERLELTLAVRTVNSSNVREHWSVRARRAKAQRIAAYARLACFAVLPRLPVRITLTRIAPRRMDDDGAVRSLKHVRDGIADAYGRDDGSDQYQWVYGQEKGGTREYGVRITIERIQGSMTNGD